MTVSALGPIRRRLAKLRRLYPQGFDEYEFIWDLDDDPGEDDGPGEEGDRDPGGD